MNTLLDPFGNRTYSKSYERLILAGLLCGLLRSCSHRLVDFTLLSFKNVPISRSAELEKADKRVKRQDSKGTPASIAAVYRISVREPLTWTRLASNVVEPGTRLLVYLQ